MKAPDLQIPTYFKVLAVIWAIFWVALIAAVFYGVYSFFLAPDVKCTQDNKECILLDLETGCYYELPDVKAICPTNSKVSDADL